MARDRAVEKWLREQVVPAAMSVEANPASALTANQVRGHLAEKRHARSRARNA